MPTNLEKLKSEIAQMDAEEFATKLHGDFVCVCIAHCPKKGMTCKECRVKWLTKEAARRRLLQ